MLRSRLRVESLEARTVPAVVGSLDPAFSSDGIVRTTFGDTETGSGVAIQPDGKIVVVGTTPGLFAVARYNPDGTLDDTFSGDGKQTVDFATAANDETATAVAVQDDGKIVLVGFGKFGGDQDFLLARLKADGTPDTDFDGDGKRIVGFGGGGTNSDRAFAVAMQGTGATRKIVVAGTSDQTTAGEFTNFHLLRLNDDGTTATSANFTLGGNEEGRGVAVDSAGRIVVVGFTDQGGGTADNFGIVRVKANGIALDTDFSGDGKLIVDVSGDDEASAVVLQTDGKIVVAGSVVGALGNFAAVRLTDAGVLDDTFSGDGKQTVTFGGNDNCRAVAIQPDGRIVLAGVTDTGGVPDNFAVARLTADGKLDPSFDADGRATVNFDADDEATGVAIDKLGRIVVAGSTTSNNDIAVARLSGGIENADVVVVGGQADGSALVLDPDAAGTLPGTPSATVGAFGGVAANVRTAAGDVNGDGFDDTILVTGPGAALRLAVVSGADDTTLLVAPFDPFGGDFTGGGFVAAGDLDGDGRAEFVVTPDLGGGPRATVFSLNPDGTRAQRANFFGIDDAGFRGGARAALGDVDGDAVPELVIAAGFGGGPRVAVFDGGTVFGTPTRLLPDFFAFPGTDAVNLRNGVFVAAGDVDGDGKAELAFGGGPGGAPRVFILAGSKLATGDVGGAQGSPVANFFVANNADDRGGVRLAVKDADGDAKADVVVGSGEGSAAKVRAYLGANFTVAGEPATFQDLTVFGGGALPGGVFVG